METIDIWFDSNFLEKQEVPRLGFPEWAESWIERPLVGFFGPPIFHFWVLQELINSCRNRLNEYRRKKIIVVDLSINNEVIDNLLEKMVDSDGRRYPDRQKLFSSLEIWLSEQLAAWLSVERVNNSWPTVVVRCVDTEWRERDRKVHEPEKVFREIMKFLSPSLKIFGVHRPLFGICFPTPEHEARTRVSLLSPHFASKIPLPLHASPLGRDVFSIEYSEIEKLCPLVAPLHAWVVVAPCPLDEKIKRTYIRHEELHETWIVGDGVWSQVPRGAWVPIPENARVVLGRVIDVFFGGMKKKKILSGSLILRVE